MPLPRRSILGALVAGSTLVGAVALGSATSASAASSPSTVGVDLKHRSLERLVHPSASTVDATRGKLAPRRALERRRGSTAPTDGIHGAPSATTTTIRRHATARDGLDAAAAADVCTDLALDVTPTNETVSVHWTAVGAQEYEVWRLRERGSWQHVTTTSATQFDDNRVNPDAVFTYLVVADGAECYLDAWVSMATADGWGVPDVIYGGGGANGDQQLGMLMVQDPWSRSVAASQAGIDPAYSQDGRLIAYANRNFMNPDEWLLSSALSTQRGTNLSAYHVPAGHAALEPAWSPDGRSLVYTLYAEAEDGTLSSPELHVLVPRTGTDRLVAGSTGLVQAQWRSSTTLVAAGTADGEGLFTLPAAGGQRTALSGTGGAAQPEVGPDGTVWFVTATDGTYGVSTVSTSGLVTPRAQSTTQWWELPRVSPDGTVFVVQGDLNDVADPADDTARVVAGFGTPDVHDTLVGVPVSDGAQGFAGYDVRQPKSKGTSDLAGDASGDILARDASGTLWVFPSGPDTFVKPRVKVGTGWNIYTSFVAAGDLNGDDRGDVVAKDKEGRLWFYAARGNAKLAARALIGSGWGQLSYLAPGDLDGGGTADLVAVKPDGYLYGFSGAGNGTTFSSYIIGTSFAGLTVIGVGDFNYDGSADLLSREKSTGRLYLSAGKGLPFGGFAAKKVVGTGWGAFTGFGTPELDAGFNGLYTRLSNGTMRYYASVGDGGFRNDEVYAVPGSWNGYTFTS